MSTTCRVAVTRDEDPDGPLSVALRGAGFLPVRCPVAEERPPAHPDALATAARALEGYDWAVFASRRAVNAITRSRLSAWPPGLRTAAVGARTAVALVAAGAREAPVVADESGADALWALLKNREDWLRRRVLVLTVSGGRRAIIDGLTAAGAAVTIVEAYRMVARPAVAIAADWKAAAPEAVVLASPKAADLLVAAIGHAALVSLQAVVAIGGTTAQALHAHGINAVTPEKQDFGAVARTLAGLFAARAAVTSHNDA